MINEIIEKTKKQIKKIIDLAEEDLKSVKTGRAKPSLIENIKVQAYEGASMDLKELASISAPDPHSLIISPWTLNIFGAIYKNSPSADLSPIRHFFCAIFAAPIIAFPAMKVILEAEVEPEFSDEDVSDAITSIISSETPSMEDANCL